MRAPDEVKEALAAIGFEAEDISPADDPAYTEFTRVNEAGAEEVFHVCFAVKGKAISAMDLMNELMQTGENLGDC